MSVLIKGIPMPKDCDECNEMGLFEVVGICWEDKDGKHCPLVEVSTPHGDLIDREKLLKEIQEYIDEYETEDEKRNSKRIPVISPWSGKAYPPPIEHSLKWCAMKEAGGVILRQATAIESEE